MTRATTASGIAFAAIVSATLPAALSHTSGRSDLLVTVPAAHATPATWTEAQVEARHAESPVEVDPTWVGSALDELRLGRFVVDYGPATRREVVWPVSSGALNLEGDPVCGYFAELRAEALSAERIRGLSGKVEEALRKRFPMQIEESGVKHTLPALSHAKLRLEPANGYLLVGLDAMLVDQTRLGASFAVVLDERGGAMVMRRSGAHPVKTYFTGPSRDALERKARGAGAKLGMATGALFGWWLGPVGAVVGASLGALAGESLGGAKAKRRMQEHVSSMSARNADDALAEASRLLASVTEPWAPNSDRPGDTIAIGLGAPPRVTPQGISLQFCIRTRFGPGKQNAAVLGSVSRDLGAAQLPPALGGLVRLSANDDAVHQMLHFAWQSGLLARAGRSSAVLERVPKPVRLAAFDFEGFVPSLPPVILRGPGLSLVLGNVRLGSVDGSDVMAHALVGATVAQRGDALRFAMDVKELGLHCARDRSGETELRPCLSDLLPIAREAAIGQPLEAELAGDELIGKLPSMAFSGVRVELSRPQLRVGGPSDRLGIGLDVSVE